MRKANTIRKVCKFAKVAAVNGAKDAFYKLRFFMAHSRCLDIADAYKVEKIIGLVEKFKHK